MKRDISLPDCFLDEHWLGRLLIVEKERRGLHKSSLVFIGIHNLSGFWWCGMQSVLKSNRSELDFFRAYLEDRMTYALLTGRISKIPRRRLDLLEIGDDLTLGEVESFHQMQLISAKAPTPKAILSKGTGMGRRKREIDPFERGLGDESEFAEKYPRFRWNFRFSDYVVVGAPDGITKDLVYEFKSTAKRFFFYFVKPVALAQADLYGLFFKKKMKRVQIYIQDEDLVESFQMPVDVARAKETLARFDHVNKGFFPQAPAKWKCTNCEVRDECCILECD